MERHDQKLLLTSQNEKKIKNFIPNTNVLQTSENRYWKWKSPSLRQLLLLLILSVVTFKLLLVLGVVHIRITCDSTNGINKILGKFRIEFESIIFKPHSLRPQCNTQNVTQRFDCYPDSSHGIKQNICEERGCCWQQTTQKGVPFCYYPQNYESYDVSNSTETEYGYSYYLSRNSSTHWPKDVMLLKVDLHYETANRFHFKIYDAQTPRYEVPLPVPVIPKRVSDTGYDVIISKQPFSMRIVRKSTQSLIFDSGSVAPLIFADQFIQFGTKLASTFIYGLGEHRTSFKQETSWKKISFWARDQPPQVESNLYGVHPFYLSVEPDGSTHGVFLLNSNAMQVDLQPLPALTYKTTGGILDFYVFLGPSPEEVIAQYLEVIGRPAMPPFWSLGFHLCRFGYRNSSDVRDVISRMRAAKMPYDTQWTDIDTMYRRLDFTVDNKTFADLPDIVDDLHQHGQHYIPLMDVGISCTQPAGSYPPYDDGLTDNVFIMNDDRTAPLVAQVWPGKTTFPDFFHPNTTEWWYKQASTFHKQVPFDGLWIDMDEPSSFVDGSVSGCHNNTLNDPPFVPVLEGGSLYSKTLCPSSQHYISSHYNLHSLSGHSEANATYGALSRILGKRSVIITRSSFAGTGQFAGHWSGDNFSRWPDLYYSISELLSFQMFGFSLMGADICGFNEETTPELCTRWMQLGAFYPFMRNHNSITSKISQDPASFNTTIQDIMRDALQTRYHLLPYLYTLMYHFHKEGIVAVKPLFFRYPNKVTYGIDTQLMWGDALLISPVLEQGSVHVSAYMPEGLWYDFYTGHPLTGHGVFVNLSAPLDTINLHIRAGAILPTFQPAVTTTLMRKSGFGILVAPTEDGTASGELYWDDGENLGAPDNGQYSLIKFNLTATTLSCSLARAGYLPEDMIILDTARILAVREKPVAVRVNDRPAQFTYEDSSQTLRITGINANLLDWVKIIWF